MLLIPVRHGETEWNVSGREMGHLDSPLTKRGVRYVHLLATRLKSAGASALYTSDLGRAIQSAKIIEQVTGLMPKLEPELRERHMGAYQGLTRSEIRERFPQQYSEYEARGFHAVIPEGESIEQRNQRSVRVLTRIAQRHAKECVIVVTHRGFLMGILEYVLGLEPGGGRRLRQEHGGYNALMCDAGNWLVETWNDTLHLAAPIPDKGGGRPLYSVPGPDASEQRGGLT